MSILNPVFACHVIEAGAEYALTNVVLPHRPQVGDKFTLFGKERTVVSTVVDWMAIPKTSSMTPPRIPCTVIVE